MKTVFFIGILTLVGTSSYGQDKPINQAPSIDTALLKEYGFRWYNLDMCRCPIMPLTDSLDKDYYPYNFFDSLKPVIIIDNKKEEKPKADANKSVIEVRKG